MREIVLDTETTGLDPSEGHRILEIAAVEIVHQVATGRVFHALINPQRDVPEDAVRVHGHTAASLRDKPLFENVVDDFFAFVADAPLVIHNAEFDVRFLNSELARIGRSSIRQDHIVDTLALARKNHPGQSNSLDALCDRYRIDRTRRVQHGALLDAEILAEIYVELKGGRQPSLSFQNEPDSCKIVFWVPARTAPRKARRSLINSVEGAAHQQHIETLGEAPIWFRFAAFQPGL